LEDITRGASAIGASVPAGFFRLERVLRVFIGSMLLEPVQHIH
jgi:hypothetical protein